MQNENRGIGRSRVELVYRRQPLLGELMLGEPADDAYPLRRRRDRDLLLQHGHRVGQRPHAVPAQFHVEVQAAADDVKVIVDQPRQDATPLQVDDLGRGARQLHYVLVVADRREDAILDGDRTRRRIRAIEGGE